MNCILEHGLKSDYFRIEIGEWDKMVKNEAEAKIRLF